MSSLTAFTRHILDGLQSRGSPVRPAPERLGPRVLRSQDLGLPTSEESPSPAPPATAPPRPPAQAHALRRHQEDLRNQLALADPQRARTTTRPAPLHLDLSADHRVPAPGPGDSRTTILRAPGFPGVLPTDERARHASIPFFPIHRASGRA